MRIRSIRPEFWSSEDIAAMDWNTRLVYIGLWSYVDDNGVGRDVEKLIVADLFPLDDDMQESSRRVHGALKHLHAAGNITRYAVDGKRYLHVSTWDKHQKINRPSGSRYPLPTRDDAVIQDALSEPSVSPQANPPLGEGEKGRRGEVNTCPPDGEASVHPIKQADTSPDIEDEFDSWYDAYPRKEARGRAFKAYKTARKKASADVLLSTVIDQTPTLTAKGREFTPHPATWLNAERWLDEPAPTEMSDEEWRERQWRAPNAPPPGMFDLPPEEDYR